MLISLLDARGVAAYLADRGLIARDFEPRISVSIISRRNHNLIVRLDGEPTWFVKQIRHPLPEIVESLRREAACYHTASQVAALAPLAELMPRCAFYDPHHAILVMEYLRAANGAEAHQVLGLWNTEVAGMIGACLGRLHALGGAAATGPRRRHQPVRRPRAVAPPDPTQLGRRAVVLSVFNADREVAAVLASLRREYQFSTLIHGDARLENILLVEPTADLRVRELRLVDWELADIGDPAWDIASVFQHYAVSHVWSRNPGIAPVLLYAALDEFWTVYESARGGVPPDERHRAMQLTGVRLIQCAYEHSTAGEAGLARVDRIGRLAHLLLIQPDSPRDAPWP
jgi:aminoglycoside phosphotransferase (APT) family kinase protein